MTGYRITSVTACSVSGGGWLIRMPGGGAQWVDTAACRTHHPDEAARIAGHGRDLILNGRDGAGRLPPEEIGWLLAAPRRVACLVDFLAASEELSRVLSTPLLVTFATTGEVRWRFGAPGPGAGEPVAWRRATPRIEAGPRSGSGPRLDADRSAIDHVHEEVVAVEEGHPDEGSPFRLENKCAARLAIPDQHRLIDVEDDRAVVTQRVRCGAVVGKLEGRDQRSR